MWLVTLSNKREFIRRPPEKRNDTRDGVKFGDKNMMLWKYIKSNDTRELWRWEIACSITGSGWWKYYGIERLISPEPWLKFHRENVNKTKEKSSSEEATQSWRVVGAQPQKMASHTCEDDERFLRISSQALKQLLKLREAAGNINNVQ